MPVLQCPEKSSFFTSPAPFLSSSWRDSQIWTKNSCSANENTSETIIRALVIEKGPLLQTCAIYFNNNKPATYKINEISER